MLSTQENGWQADGTANGDTSVLHTEGVTYQLEGVTKTYTEYISGFNAATSRTLTFTPRTDAPRLLYTFSYSTSDMAQIPPTRSAGSCDIRKTRKRPDRPGSGSSQPWYPAFEGSADL